ncbi:hypothetical protein [Dyadobacter frigoris]|uniref:Uncharacterized protein n=1 Tax=Dyadobacter frigoris TaxID=2576211 RepID=A0A4V6Y1W7_9BACT|nr:hypothetical protein [Dyadobacter frigoris]TKT89503.1 hypothetical protein FDK13_24480 [Dyadobacter frigoris]
MNQSFNKVSSGRIKAAQALITSGNYILITINSERNVAGGNVDTFSDLPLEVQKEVMTKVVECRDAVRNDN